MIFNINKGIAGKHYRADIDGLRSLAILPVLLFHANIAWFPGGYVGVDIFFVISGYLITKIIYREVTQDDFSILRFYERRARRILPALLFTLSATSLLATIVLLPDDLVVFGQSILAALLFLSNYFFMAVLGDYFSTDVEFSPLLHTWSLAVEEQFYIFFPLFLIGVYRFRHRLSVPWSLGILAMVSFGWSEIVRWGNPEAAFFGTPSRVWELALGALLAVGVGASRGTRPVREAAGLAGLVMIGVTVVFYDDSNPFPGIGAVLPCLGSALLLWSGQGCQTLARRLLSLPPFVFVGLISYSLYLVHWPIMALLRNVTGGAILSGKVAVAALLLSFAGAIFSWALVERPFRTRESMSLRSVFAVTGGWAAVLLLVGGLFWSSGGLSGRFGKDIELIAAGASDRNPRREQCFDHWPQGGPCLLGVTDPEVPPSFLVWGDSHADALAPGMDRAAALAGRKGVLIGHGGCPPLLGMLIADHAKGQKCLALYDRVIPYLQDNEEISTVILIGRWAKAAGLGRPERPNQRPRQMQDTWQAEAAVPSDLDLFRRGINRTVDAIRALERRVVLLNGTPEIGWNVPAKLLNHERYGLSLPPAPDRGAVHRRNAEVTAVFEGLAEDLGVRIVDLNDVLCPGRCSLLADGRPLYRDADHLSRYAGEVLLAPVIAERVWRDCSSDAGAGAQHCPKQPSGG